MPEDIYDSLGVAKHPVSQNPRHKPSTPVAALASLSMSAPKVRIHDTMGVAILADDMARLTDAPVR